MESNLLKMKDVAKLLSISKSMAYKLIAQGKVPSVRFGKIVRVKSDDLQKFIDEHSTNNEAQPNWLISKKKAS